MARQKGVIKLQGSLDEISFYQTEDGFLARKRGGVDSQRIKNDPAFARTRENNQEFGESGRTGKFVRQALKVLVKRTKDSRAVSRMTQLMSQIKNLDTTSARGKRTVASGMQNPLAVEVLRNFNFNSNAPLSEVLNSPFTVDEATGAISFTVLSPLEDVVAPPQATHVGLRCAMSTVDLVSGASETFYSPMVLLALDGAPAPVTLTPEAPSTGTGVTLYALMVCFYQRLNGIDYPLNNEQFNALQIVEVVV